MNTVIDSRHKIVNDFVKSDYSLCIGCKDTSFGTINIDVELSNQTDIIGSVLCLPFKDNSFKTIIFTDVLEHIPINTELKALKEIKRVMTDKLILTTPNDIPLYTYLDPAFYQVAHRHYKVSFVNKLMKDAGFNKYTISVKGDKWHMLYLLFRYIIYFRVNRFLKPSFNITPQWLINKVNDSYKVDGNYGIYVMVF